MKKRFFALALCLMLLASLAVPAAKADEVVFFTAMGESILPLNDETMPFLSGSQIYIPSSIFSGTVRRQLDVSSTYNKAQNLVILYRGSQSLWFYLDRNHARDHEDSTYYPGAVVRGGEVFVPAALVARFFDLTYTVAEVPHGYMVWFRKQGYPLTEDRFVDAASYSLESRYAAYEKVKAEEAAKEPEKEEIPVLDGRSVCLALAAGESTARQLDMLESKGAYGAVFFTPEQMLRQGGILRRMSARGHSIAIRIPNGTEDVLQAVEQANQALEDATCSRTRLVRVEDDNEETLAALRAAGYCPVSFHLISSTLRTAVHAETLVQRISRSGSGVKVWLGEDVSITGLVELLRAVETAEGRCRALSEIN